MRGFAGPWVLLPGNHDAGAGRGGMEPAGAAGPAGQRRRGRQRRRPIALADGRLVVLPAPLTERHTSDDLTAWMDAAVTPSGARAGRPRPRLGRRAAARGGRRRQPDRSRARRTGRGSTIWRWATGTARSRSARAPGTPARPSPTASAPTMPATCSWSSWTSRRAARGHTPAHRTARLAPAEPRSHRRRRPQGARWIGCSPESPPRSAPWSSSRSPACSTWSHVRRWKPALDRWAGELCHLEVRDELVAEPERARPPAASANRR